MDHFGSIIAKELPFAIKIKPTAFVDSKLMSWLKWQYGDDGLTCRCTIFRSPRWVRIDSGAAYVVYQHHIYFRKQRDAMLFKLTWSGYIE